LREEASRALVALGTPARRFLEKALTDPDPEIARRAERCIAEIDRGPGAALPVAALRMLVRRQPVGSVETLLSFVAYADDDTVEDEVLTALVALHVREGQVDPALRSALNDPTASRRAAAAYTLGRLRDKDVTEQVVRLLVDSDIKVRLRAAQGLLAGRERAAVPALIALLESAPPDISWQTEELLQRLAIQDTPNVPTDDGTPEIRRKRREGWEAWWREKGDKVDLGRLEEQRLLGLTLVAELDSNRVWEFGPDGKPRWELPNLQGPIDAQMLPNRRVLVAEHNVPRVVEYDLQGKVHWEKRVNGNPIACQRLPNGNTFVATYNHVAEYTPQGREAYSHNLNHLGQGVIFDAQKLRNGHIVCISAQGKLLELDAVTGKPVNTVQVTTNGGWCGVEALSGGRFLVAITNQNKVVEIDGHGKTLWECVVPGACHASRLPTGNTLVACMTTNRITEVDRNGKKVMEKTTQGRPFHVHRR
jgi:hypothetical protein